MRNKKLQVWLPLIFSLVMISGMFFGFKLHQQTGGRDGFKDVIRQLCDSYEFDLGTIMKNPMAGLIKYHNGS